MFDDGAVGLASHHAAIEHRHEQQPSVGEPAEARRTTVPFDLDTTLVIVADRRDRALVEVAEPQTSEVPTRAFAEVDAVDDQFPVARSTCGRYTSAHPANLAGVTVKRCNGG